MAFSKNDLTYGGYLVIRPVSAEEHTVIWNISECLRYKCCRDNTILMSQDFCLAGATWGLFAKLTPLPTVCGMNVQKRKSSADVLECFCNMTHQNNNDQVIKSFELMFEIGEAMTFMKMDNTQHQVSDTGENGAVIVCQIRTKKSADITHSSNSSAVEFCNATPLQELVVSTAGKLLSRFISAGESELVWDISSCLQNATLNERIDLNTAEFSFAGARWRLFAIVTQFSISFGIDGRRHNSSKKVSDLHSSSNKLSDLHSSSNGVFDYCCIISYQNRVGEVFKSFKMKFKYGKSKPLLRLEDSFKITNMDRDILLKLGSIIVCRFIKPSTTTKECSQIDITFSRGNSAVEVSDPSYRPENDCQQLYQDLKRLQIHG